MDNVLRCSIIFIILHTFCFNSGFGSPNPMIRPIFEKVMAQNHFNSIYSNEPNESDLPWSKEENDSHKPIFGNYDFDDYNHGEDLDNNVNYSNENTQSVDSDYNDDDEYEDEESLISAKKRSRYMPQNKRTDPHLDLCPYHNRKYKIQQHYAKSNYVARLNYTEKVCNHTKISRDYNQHYNRICYQIGRTFEYGHGTHCFQRTISKEIEIHSVSDKKRLIYTENHFRYGCTCGWATDELGPIDDYHYDKILNLCSELKDKA